MTPRVLSHDVVALVHHVELAATGWRDRLCEQLLLASMSVRDGPQDVESLTRDISREIGRTVSAGALTAASQRLIGRGLAVRSASQEIMLSQTGLEEVRERREASAALEQQAKATFSRLAGEMCPDIANEALWGQFVVGCLEPTVAELGARTYQLMAGTSENVGPVRSMAAFVDRFPQELQLPLRRLIDRFLDPSDRIVRDYVLQQLNAHFMSLAASLSDQALSSLTGRLRQAVHLRLFLDTNFLFSVLDLHDNPANEAARELVSLLKKLHGKLDYTLYVYPLTIDELKRTLAGYEHTLSGAYLTPKLGRAALAVGTRVSGFVLRYLRAVAESKSRITARDFLAPYLTDPISVLRARGVELYNANIDGLTTSQPVIDDIVDQQAFETEHYPDRVKPYEALRHDIALWHLVNARRGSNLSSALDATYWVVTIDYRFLGFDSYKGKAGHSALPVCVHPAVLLQMLQLWLPRDESVDRALLEGIRSLLPQIFDLQAEQTAVRILGTLARYENVDDLDEDTISQILMNQALGDRIRMVDDVSQQVDLVREAIIVQFAQAKVQVAALVADKERLQVLLDRGSTDRDALTARVATLEESLHRAAESHAAGLEEQRRTRQLAVFLIAAALGGIGTIIAGVLLPHYLVGFSTMSARRATLLSWTAAAGIAGLEIWAVGVGLPTVRSAPWFHRLAATMKWLLGTIWVVVLGLVTSYLWERF